jgi:hypothetical protein
MTDQTIIKQVKLPNETLFAWTSVGDYRYYPQFVNVSRKDGRIVISVRSLEDTTGEHPRTGNQAVAALPDEEVQRLVTALQSSAVLPSEAMVPGGLGKDGTWGTAANPARAATPTAPVQDDDAELVEKLRRFAQTGRDRRYNLTLNGYHADTFDRCADTIERLSRLSPTPETGLVEALKMEEK